jgi:hypothetical protein
MRSPVRYRFVCMGRYRLRAALGPALALLVACASSDAVPPGGPSNDGSATSSDDASAPAADGAAQPPPGERDAARGQEAASLPPVDGSGPSPPGDSPSSSSSAACQMSQALRGGPGCHFLVGMGNDLNNNHDQDGAYTLGPTLDVHYTYLSGLPTKGGWPDWNANGSFVNLLTDSADRHGVTPMFTLYMMAGNVAMTTDDASMNLYWQAAKLMFQRLAIFGKAALVHFEPDFWGFAMQQSAGATARAIVTAHAPDCAGLPDNVIGMADCLVKLGRTYAPKAMLGFHVSTWGFTTAQIVQFFKAIHADRADLLVTDMLDRDAGCFEAHTDMNCQRNDGPWYWDESNVAKPNFHDNLASWKAIHDGLGLPLMWWQIPFGVPSTTPGGTAGHYRDNRVHYMFNHIDEFVAAGGVGAVFGGGAANQTYITTDGGQFQSAVTKYFASPSGLP